MTDPPIDVHTVVHDEHHSEMLAAAKIAKVFLEGLHDALSLPEVHSEADEATHYLLGCDLYMAMFMMTSLLHDGSDGPQGALTILDRLLTQQLTNAATMVVAARGPIGACTCQRS